MKEFLNSGPLVVSVITCVLCFLRLITRLGQVKSYGFIVGELAFVTAMLYAMKTAVLTVGGEIGLSAAAPLCMMLWFFSGSIILYQTAFLQHDAN